jgi:hypothetical protein
MENDVIRALAIVGTLLLTGGANAAERKAPEVLIMGNDSLITKPHDSKSVYTGSQAGGSLIITDPRTMKTVAVIPKERK